MAATMLEVVQKFFKEDDWPFTVTEQGLIRTKIEMENGSYIILVQIFADVESVVVYAYSPDAVAEGLRPKMSEFITRANYGLRIATFEMDFADGELRCRSGLRVEPAELTGDLVSRLVYSAAICMNRYYPGLAAVSLTSRSPSEIIQQIEGG